MRAVMPDDAQSAMLGPALDEGGFEPYIRAIRKHPLILAVVALAAVLGAAAWLLIRVPHYRATAQLVVTPAAFDDSTYNGLPVLKETGGDPPRVMQTAAATFNSPSAVAAAAQRVGWSAARLGASLNVVPVGGANVLAVQSTTTDPVVAARIANAFVHAELAQRKQVLRRETRLLIGQLKGAPRVAWGRVALLYPVSEGFDPTFSLAHPASVPRSAIGGPAWRILLVALFAGFVLGTAAAVLAEALRRRPSPVPKLSPGDSTVP